VRLAGLLTRTGKFVTVASALGLLCGYGGQLAWPLELFANFRVQYGIAFVVGGACLLAARNFRWGLFALSSAAFCMISVLVQAGWPWSNIPILTPADASRRATFRLVYFNTWFRNQDLTRTAAYLERVGADAVILLELNAGAARRLQALLPSYRFAHIDTEPHGAVFFSRWPLADQQFWPLCSQCTRMARATLYWRGQAITLLGAHLHWPIGPQAATLRRAELQALARLARSQPQATLLAGDFNLTPWSLYFDEFLEGSALADCGRGRGLLPTWPAQLASFGIRIDHCFASQDWQTAGIGVGPELGSDHLPSVVDLTL
jgi:endonuclease/exonuclease/phosphatase (EEP) superfamily protein YafD